MDCCSNNDGDNDVSDTRRHYTLSRRAALTTSAWTASTAMVGCCCIRSDPVLAAEATGPPPSVPMTPTMPPSSAYYPPLRPGKPVEVVSLDGSPAADSPTPRTALGRQRLTALDLSPLQQPLSPFADRDVIYPRRFLGTWTVTATLRRKYYPYGTEYAPSRSLVDGSPRNRMEQVGDATSFRMRFIELPGGDGNKVIADRSYNAVSLSSAYGQLTPVQEVKWDPVKDSTRLVVEYGAGLLDKDMRPLGPRRGEVYLTARRSDESSSTSGGGGTEDQGAFCAAERSRSVTLTAGNVVVSDSETITEYRYDDEDGHNAKDNMIGATQRIAVYLTPNPNSREGVLWQQVGGKAVAFFDYDLTLKRVTEVR